MYVPGSASPARTDSITRYPLFIDFMINFGP
jgi:hypothetical protein